MSSKKHHQYLNDLGINSKEICVFNTRYKEKGKRGKRFEKQRKAYGFDERETWCLEWTMIGWMYSHLAMYLDIGGRVADFGIKVFDIPVLEDIPKDEIEYLDPDKKLSIAYQRTVIMNDVTKEEAIRIAMEYMRYFLENIDATIPEKLIRCEECAVCAMKIVAEIMPSLWW